MPCLLSVPHRGKLEAFLKSALWSSDAVICKIPLLFTKILNLKSSHILNKKIFKHEYISSRHKLFNKVKNVMVDKAILWVSNTA